MERPVDKDIIHLGAATNLKHQKDAVLLLHNRGGKKSLDFCHDEVEKLNVSLQWFLVLPYLIFFFKRLNSFFKKKKKKHCPISLLLFLFISWPCHLACRILVWKCGVLTTELPGNS